MKPFYAAFVKELTYETCLAEDFVMLSMNHLTRKLGFQFAIGLNDVLEFVYSNQSVRDHRWVDLDGMGELGREIAEKYAHGKKFKKNI